MDNNQNKEGVTKADFVSSFKNVVDFAKGVRDNAARQLGIVHQAVQQHETKVAAHDTAIQELKASHAALSTKIDKRLASLKNGQDGASGTPGRNGSPDSSTQVRNKLQSLEGDDRIDVSAIKGLDNYPDLIKWASTPTIVRAAHPHIFLIDLSSQLNGSLKTFALPTNFGIINVASSSAPFTFRPIIDYSQVGKNIVFTASVDAPSALATGQSLIVTILK